MEALWIGAVGFVFSWQFSDYSARHHTAYPTLRPKDAAPQRINRKRHFFPVIWPLFAQSAAACIKTTLSHVQICADSLNQEPLQWRISLCVLYHWNEFSIQISAHIICSHRLRGEQACQTITALSWLIRSHGWRPPRNELSSELLKIAFFAGSDCKFITNQTEEIITFSMCAVYGNTSIVRPRLSPDFDYAWTIFAIVEVAEFYWKSIRCLCIFLGSNRSTLSSPDDIECRYPHYGAIWLSRVAYQAQIYLLRLNKIAFSSKLMRLVVFWHFDQFDVVIQAHISA